MSTPYECPNKCDLRGAPIPDVSQHHYGDATHFSECIGIYDQMKDRTVAYRCPKCGIEWDRT